MPWKQHSSYHFAYNTPRSTTRRSSRDPPNIKTTNERRPKVMDAHYATSSRMSSPAIEQLDPFGAEHPEPGECSEYESPATCSNNAGKKSTQKKNPPTRSSLISKPPASRTSRRSMMQPSKVCTQSLAQMKLASSNDCDSHPVQEVARDFVFNTNSMCSKSSTNMASLAFRLPRESWNCLIKLYASSILTRRS